MAKSLTVASIEKLKPDPQRPVRSPRRPAPRPLPYHPAGRGEELGGALPPRRPLAQIHDGPYPAFDLGAARQEASQALQRAQRGGDPAREKRIERRRSAEARGQLRERRAAVHRKVRQTEQPHLGPSSARLRVGPVPRTSRARFRGREGRARGKMGLPQDRRHRAHRHHRPARRHRGPQGADHGRIGCSPICASCSTGRWKAT